MVVIRLARAGRKNLPVYKITVADKTAPLGGRYLEKIGLYVPGKDGSADSFTINKERYDHWVKVGAQPTDRMKLLMKTLAVGKIPKPRRKKKAAAAAPAAE
jgi:small subunit ribosomal protein S16